jgi:hypothetical protein
MIIYLENLLDSVENGYTFNRTVGYIINIWLYIAGSRIYMFVNKNKFENTMEERILFSTLTKRIEK